MLLRESKSTSIFAYPAVASATVLLFLLRNRQITAGNSPGSGVSIASAELLVRASQILHATASVAAQGSSLSLRVAMAPMIFSVATLQAELRIALGAVHGIGDFVQHAAPYLLHTF